MVPEEDEDEGVEEEMLVEHLLEGIILPPHCQVLQLSKGCLQDPFPWRNRLKQQPRAEAIVRINEYSILYEFIQHRHSRGTW